MKKVRFDINNGKMYHYLYGLFENYNTERQNGILWDALDLMSGPMYGNSIHCVITLAVYERMNTEEELVFNQMFS